MSKITLFLRKDFDWGKIENKAFSVQQAGAGTEFGNINFIKCSLAKDLSKISTNFE